MSRILRPVLLSLVLLVVVLVHLGSLDNSFHYDDGHSIQRNPHIRDLANIPRFFVDSSLFSENPDYAMYRPLVLVLHTLNHALGEHDPAGYIALNLVVHALVTALAFHVLVQLGLSLSAATMGALLFGLHPVQSEVVNFVSARSESLAAGCLLLSFYAYLRSTTSLGGIRVCSEKFRIVSLLAFGLGLLSKATVIALPLVLLAYAWLRTSSSLRWADLARAQLPYWVVAAFYVVVYLGLGAESIERSGEVRSVASQVSTQAKAAPHYLKLSAMPTELTVYHQFFISDSLAEWAPLLGLVAGLSLAVIVLMCRGPSLAAFGAAWFVLVLSPTMVIPLNLAVNDHRLYLAVFGLATTLAAAGRGRLFGFGMIGVVILFAVLSAQQGDVWQDELSVWGNAAARAPLMPEAHYNLGFAYHQVGDTERARQAYERTVELDPNHAEAQANLASIYRERGELVKAEAAIAAALKADPSLPGALNSLGLLLMDKGELQGAAEVFQKMLAADPNLAEAHFNLGLIYRDLRKPALATDHLTRAIQLKPDLKTTTVGRDPVQR